MLFAFVLQDGQVFSSVVGKEVCERRDGRNGWDRYLLFCGD